MKQPTLLNAFLPSLSARVLVTLLSVFLSGLLPSLPGKADTPIITKYPEGITTGTETEVVFECQGKGSRLVWEVKRPDELKFIPFSQHPLTVPNNVVDFSRKSKETGIWSAMLGVAPRHTPFQESLFRCVLSSGKEVVTSPAVRLCLCLDMRDIHCHVRYNNNQMEIDWDSAYDSHCCDDDFVRYRVQIQDISEGREVLNSPSAVCCGLTVRKPFRPCHRYRVSVTPETEDEIGETAEYELLRPGIFFNITSVYATRNDNTGQYYLQVVLKRKPGTLPRICPQILIVAHGGDTDEYELNHQYNQPLQYRIALTIEPQWRRDKYPVTATLVNEYDQPQSQYQTVLDLPLQPVPTSDESSPYPEAQAEQRLETAPIALIGLLGSVSAMAIFSCYTGLPCKLMRCR